MKGKFIVLEGLDRSGKSSVASFLQQSYQSNQTKILNMRFPNRKSLTGQMINNFLNKQLSIGHEAIHLLFSANRWQAKRDIEQALQNGNNIICDRYWYSGVAYSYAKGLDFDWCMNPDKGLPQPHLVIILRGDPKKLANREGYGHQIFEVVEFQQKVSEGYDKLTQTLGKDYIKQINTEEKSLEQVKDEVLKLVKDHFSQNR